MKYARIVSGTAVDVRTESPEGFFTPNIVAEFVTVPDVVEHGWTWDGDEWVAPEPIPEPTPQPEPPKQLTPVEFKMCFTSAERLAITAIMDNAEHQASPTLKDVYSILDDPRLKIVDLGLQSNLDLIDFLVSLNVLTSDRAAEIKDGVLK